VNNRTAQKLTREFIRNNKRIAQLSERNDAIKSEILAGFPDGIETPIGKWQVYGEGQRVSFERKSLESLVNALVLEGNGDVAKRILETKTESLTKGGVRFYAVKGDA